MALWRATIAVVTTPHGRQVKRWPVSSEVGKQALSLASQRPQVPISSRQPHDGKAACGSNCHFDSVHARPRAASGGALSLASQLPQVPISSRRPHDGSAACGSGLARDSAWSVTACIAGKPAPTKGLRWSVSQPCGPARAPRLRSIQPVHHCHHHQYDQTHDRPRIDTGPRLAHLGRMSHGTASCDCMNAHPGS